jgi:hypothetical protein
MQQFDSQPVARIEALLIVVVVENPDPPISQHTITVHQEQPDARRS